MKPIHRLTLVVIALALGCSAGPDPKEKARFESLSHQYIVGNFAFNPSFATAWGFHDFDDSLENWTPEAIQAEEARIRKALEDVKTIDPAKLDRATGIDYDMFRS